MRAVIIEDQVMFREFIRLVLENDFAFTVVGEAADGIEALRVCREQHPDLVLLDILIPRLSGLHVARTLREEMPQTRILMLSSECDASTLHQLNELRVDGFVDKVGQDIDVLRRAIRTVSEGGRYFADVVQQTLADLREQPEAFPKLLSPREMEVLSLVGGGLSDTEIGRILGLSPDSVKSHRRNIMKKLSIHNTPDLVQFAHDHGFWKHQFNRMDLSRTYHVFKLGQP